MDRWPRRSQREDRTYSPGSSRICVPRDSACRGEPRSRPPAVAPQTAWSSSCRHRHGRRDLSSTGEFGRCTPFSTSLRVIEPAQSPRRSYDSHWQNCKGIPGCRSEFLRCRNEIENSRQVPPIVAKDRRHGRRSVGEGPANEAVDVALRRPQPTDGIGAERIRGLLLRSRSSRRPSKGDCRN